jgi:nitroimidazol reductase NimA-like FMN-containing flavoprotein (pyridoxamine 5'-phosphate oxidase superfamily)
MANVPGTLLVHLSFEECEAHLRQAEIGRLGVLIDGKPTVFPVCHVYDRHAIAFPTNEGTKMHAALSWPYVGFEVDGLDPDGSSGWSVMISGKAEPVDDADERRRLSEMRSVPWRDSSQVGWMRVIPDEVTGRRIFGLGANPG